MTIPVKPLPAAMCLLPDSITTDYYGDYPEKALPAILLALKATNDHNRSINTVNGASE